MHTMKKLIASLIIFTIIFPLSAIARGLGDYARDYSARLERQRVERERISSLRDARIQKRLSIRQQARSRTVKKRSSSRVLSAKERLERRKRARIHLEQKRWSRIEDRKMARTWQEKARNVKDHTDWRLDARRRADLGSILEIFSLYIYDPDLPNADLLPDTEQEICKSNAVGCSGLDLDVLITGRGLSAFPYDPGVGQLDPGTGYFVRKTSSGGVLGLLMKAPMGNNGEGVEIDWRCTQCSAQ